MFGICKKLKMLKQRLKVFSREVFLPEMRVGLALEKDLTEIQARLLGDQALSNDHDEEVELYQKVVTTKRWEESMAKQQAKVHWLLQGDSNTTFFHTKAKARRCSNTIRMVKDVQGN